MATHTDAPVMHHVDPGADLTTCGLPRVTLSTSTAWAPVTCGDCLATREPARATVAEAIAAWEAKGPTSLAVSLMVDALYGVREAVEGPPRVGL